MRIMVKRQFEKSQLGAVRPGHRYLKREGRPGRYRYVYRAPEVKPEAKTPKARIDEIMAEAAEARALRFEDPEDSRRQIVIMRSAKEKGKWQLQLIDFVNPDKPMKGDEQHGSLRAAVASAVQKWRYDLKEMRGLSQIQKAMVLVWTKALRSRPGLVLLPSRRDPKKRRWQRPGEGTKPVGVREGQPLEDVSSAIRASASSAESSAQKKSWPKVKSGISTHLPVSGSKRSTYPVPSGFSMVRRIVSSQSQYESILSKYPSLPTSIVHKIKKRFQKSVKTNLPEFIGILTPLQKHIRGSQIDVDVKQPISIARKVAQGKPIDTQTDHVRARIWINSTRDVRRIEKWIRTNYPDAKIDNRFDKPKRTGYRRFHIDFTLKDGTKAELQVQPQTARGMLEEAHAIRDRIFEIKLKGSRVGLRKLYSDSRALFEPAYKQFFGPGAIRMKKSIKGRQGLALLPSRKRIGVRRWQRLGEKPQVREQQALYEAEKTQVKVTNIPVSMIERNEKQPRKYFDPKALEELASSIEKHGLQQPIVVRPIPGEKGRFQIVAGERRWRAHQIAGIETVASIIRHLSDKEAAEVALLENITRQDLTPIEEGNAYRQMLDMDWSLQELSETTGKSTSYVRSMMTLSDLVPEAQKLVESGELGVTMALKIAGIENHDLQRVALRRAKKGDMSTEEYNLYVETLKAEQKLLPLFGGEMEEANRLPEGITNKRAKGIAHRYNDLINDVARMIRRAINAKDFSVYPRVLQGDLGRKIDQLEVIEKGVRSIRQQLMKEQQRRGILRTAQAAERMKKLREAGKFGKSTQTALPLEEKITRLKALLKELLEVATACGRDSSQAPQRIGISKSVYLGDWLSKSKRVMRPGIRGGKFYFTRTGHIVYGTPPTGRVREAKPEETGKGGPRVGVRGKMQNMFLSLKKTGSILVSRTSVAGPEDAARMMSFLKKSDREKCYVINMDKNDKVLNIHLISMGTISASLVHPREAFKTALLSKAKKVWFVHNHPSGKSDPSKDDRGLTDRLYRVGKDLKVEVLGHVIVGLDDFSAVCPEHTESVLSGPSPKEEERKKRIKVVTAELSEEMMAGVLSARRKITEPSHAAVIGATILSPDKPMVAVIYLSAQRNVLGIEVIGSHLKKLGRSTDKILKSSVLHNADSVLVVASRNSKIDHAAYMELNGKFEGLGIELLDTVKCSSRVGESFISYKKGDNIFKSFRRFIHKAVVGGVRPGHKYIKRVRTPAGKWRYYYYDKKTGRVIAQEEGKTVAVGKKPEQPAAKPRETPEEEKRGVSQPPGRKEIPPVAQEEDPEFCRLYWRQIRQSGFSKMKFSEFVDSETEKQGDELLLKGETSGYNVTMYEVGESGGFAAAMKAKELSLIYSMYNIHPEHGKKVITEIAKTDAKFDYAIVKKASAVRWDESWGEDPAVEVQKHGDQLIGKSLEYSIIFRPDSKEDAEKIATWLNDKADANHEGALEDSWYVPDVRQTGKETVDKYEDAVVNMKKVGNQQLIVMTQETELEGFEHLKLKTNSSLRQYFTKGMAKSRKVMRPGLRGGKYYISKQGYVRYGEKPKGRLNKERLAKLIQMYRPRIESRLRPLIKRYRLSPDAMPDLMSAYTEGALRSLQEKSSSGFDPWLHARKRGYETAKRWAQKQGPFRLPNPEQGYRDLMQIKTVQERYAKENASNPSEEKIARELGMRVERVKELLAWDQLRGKEMTPNTPGLPSVPSAEEVFETEEEERRRQRAFETIRQETEKLPATQRKIAVALMGEGGTLKETRRRIGVSTGAFYREKQKVRRKLKKLKPIWVRFGKTLRVGAR